VGAQMLKSRRAVRARRTDSTIPKVAVQNDAPIWNWNNGFSQMDNGKLDRLRASVPAYLPVSTINEPTSRFSDYP
jgi:hypothetical protein